MAERERDRYRIAEFAKMVGVDPSTVRYYEKHGLRGKQRDENGYRVFDKYDAFQMNAFRSLCARGYSISEALKRMEPTDTAVLLREFEQNSREMDRELLLLEGRRRWTQETLQLLTIFSQEQAPLWRVELEDFYYLPASIEGDFSITQENGEVRKAWEEWLGYTRFVGLGDGGAFARGENAHIGLGEAVRAGDFERLGYPADRTVCRIPMGECLCFPDTPPAKGGLSGKKLALDYLARNGLEPAGRFLCFYFMLNTRQERAADSIIALPVRPGSAEKG